MQTFLPYKDFEKTAQALDWRRLGRQRVETLQILKTLMGDSNAWASHPAVQMWKGHEYQLARYGLYMCKEWEARGYNRGVTRGQIMAYYKTLKADPETNRELPSWLGKKKFHRSHRRMLVWKAPDHYLRLFPDIEGVPDTKPEYRWPV